MKLSENQQTELKADYTEEIKRTVVAFANGEGGTIYIGVDDNGEVTGLADADAVCQKITSSCRNAIKPDITMFLKVERMTMDGKEVVAVKVGGGSAAPYYLADKGLKPSGVYLRHGASSIPASDGIPASQRNGPAYPLLPQRASPSAPTGVCLRFS